jgi:hypothetical protein
MSRTINEITIRHPSAEITTGDRSVFGQLHTEGAEITIGYPSTFRRLHTEGNYAVFVVTQGRSSGTCTWSPG